MAWPHREQRENPFQLLYLHLWPPSPLPVLLSRKDEPSIHHDALGPTSLLAQPPFLPPCRLRFDVSKASHNLCVQKAADPPSPLKSTATNPTLSLENRRSSLAPASTLVHTVAKPLLLNYLQEVPFCPPCHLSPGRFKPCHPAHLLPAFLASSQHHRPPRLVPPPPPPPPTAQLCPTSRRRHLKASVMPLPRLSWHITCHSFPKAGIRGKTRKTNCQSPWDLTYRGGRQTRTTAAAS